MVVEKWHCDSAGGGLAKLWYSTMALEKMWCATLFSPPVSQHQTLSNRRYFSPNQQKRSSSLSCGFLFPDSLVKNSMSGHPWHANLPSIPHLAHLWQQYGLRLRPTPPPPPPVNMLKQMFYDPCLRHLALASLRGVHQGLRRGFEDFIYPPSRRRLPRCHVRL